MKLIAEKKIKRLFINIDMVNGFINCGSMHDKGINKIVKSQIDLIDGNMKSGDELVFIKEAHSENASEFEKFPKHCVKGTEEAEIVEELQKYAKNAKIFEKNSTSAMFSVGFMKYLSKLVNLQEIVLMGCCTDICVLNLALPLVNYFDQINRKVNIVVPKNVVETYDAPYHSRDEYNEIAFKLMKQAGIKVVDKYNR